LDLVSALGVALHDTSVFAVPKRFLVGRVALPESAFSIKDG
jgi:hypothetical protein